MRNICLLLAVIVSLLLAAPLHAAPATQPATQPTKLATERAEGLKAELQNFTLTLNYTGEESKASFHRLYLSVPEMNGRKEVHPLYHRVRITQEQAGKIVDYLAVEGFLDKAVDGRLNADEIPVDESRYTLMVVVNHVGEPIRYERLLPWDASLLQRLDGLRKVLDGDAAKAMEALVDRLAAQQTAWAKEAAGK